MKTLVTLSAVAMLTVALAGFGSVTMAQANGHRHWRGHSQVYVNPGAQRNYMRARNQAYNNANGPNNTGYDPRYDVRGALVGSDPNNPIFRDADSAYRAGF